MREAKGEYIVFIDSDDYFHKENLKKAVEYQKKLMLDILMLDFHRLTKKNPVPKTTLNFKNQEILNGSDFIKINSCPIGPCKFIFKRQLMVDKEIFFVEKVSCEDVDWSFNLVLNASNIQYLPWVLSHVIINDKSQTALEHKSINTIKDKFFAGIRLLDLKKNNKILQEGELSIYLNKIANQYFYEGIKYMNACIAPIKQKKKIIDKYLLLNEDSSSFMTSIKSHSYVYSIITNIASLFVPFLIYLKRLNFGR